MHIRESFMHIRNRDKIKKWIGIVVIAILILVFCLSTLYVLHFSAIGKVVQVRPASILVDLYNPTIFWFGPEELDCVILYVDNASDYAVGDVVYAYSGKVMLQSDPPKFNTRWCWRIYKANS